MKYKHGGAESDNWSPVAGRQTATPSMVKLNAKKVNRNRRDPTRRGVERRGDPGAIRWAAPPSYAVVLDAEAFRHVLDAEFVESGEVLFGGRVVAIV